MERSNRKSTNTFLDQGILSFISKDGLFCNVVEQKCGNFANIKSIIFSSSINGVFVTSIVSFYANQLSLKS